MTKKIFLLLAIVFATSCYAASDEKPTYAYIWGDDWTWINFSISSKTRYTKADKQWSAVEPGHCKIYHTNYEWTSNCKYYFLNKIILNGKELDIPISCVNELDLQAGDSLKIYSLYDQTDYEVELDDPLDIVQNVKHEYQTIWFDNGPETIEAGSGPVFTFDDLHWRNIIYTINGEEHKYVRPDTYWDREVIIPVRSNMNISVTGEKIDSVHFTIDVDDPTACCVCSEKDSFYGYYSADNAIKLQPGLNDVTVKINEDGWLHINAIDKNHVVDEVTFNDVPGTWTCGPWQVPLLENMKVVIRTSSKTGINEVKASSAPTVKKHLENGHVVIEKGEMLFNALGGRLK